MKSRHREWVCYKHKTNVPLCYSEAYQLKSGEQYATASVPLDPNTYENTEVGIKCDSTKTLANSSNL